MRSSCAFAAAVALLFLTSCAKTGDPQPPQVRMPKPAVDLAARQVSDEIWLSLSAPVENTDRSPATTLARVEIYRRMEDKATSIVPLNDEEFLRGAQQIFQVTADQLPAHQQGNKLVFRDPLTLADRSTIFHRRFRYAVRFINTKNQTAGLGNQVHLEPVAIAETPGGLTSQLSQDSIKIRWIPPHRNIDGSSPARIAGYNIYRDESPGLSPIPLNKEPLQAPEYEDRGFEFDKTYYYAVTVVGSALHPVESLPSSILSVQTRDTFAPGPPGELSLVEEKPVVILLWVAPPESDVAGYRIYRREAGAQEKQQLGNELIETLSYRDEKAESGKKYEYSVTAVDTHGNEGPPASASIEVP
jgi:hypothetical protein